MARPDSSSPDANQLRELRGDLALARAGLYSHAMELAFMRANAYPLTIGQLREGQRLQAACEHLRLRYERALGRIRIAKAV